MSAEGVPMAWSVAGPDGQLLRDGEHPFVAWLRIQADTRATEANVWRHRESGPFRVVPLYAHPAAASAESIHAEVIEECARVAEGVDELAVTANWDNGDDIAHEVKKAVVEQIRRLNALRSLLAASRANKEV